MSRSISRRIEVLEKAAHVVCNRRRDIALNAFRRLQYAQMELLISAFGGAIDGRAISADEIAADQVYRETLSLECRLAGYSYVEGVEYTLGIRDALNVALNRWRSNLEGFEWGNTLSAIGIRGRPLTPEETAALQKYNAQDARLHRLAGLPVPAEAGDSQEVSK